MSNEDNNLEHPEASQRDYKNVVLPDHKDYEEWNANERRAYILKEIEKRGIPKNLPKQDIAHQFGVVPSRITQDLRIIKEYLETNSDLNFSTEAETILKSAILKLADEEPYKAAKAVKLWDEFLERRGSVANESESADLDVLIENANVELDNIEEESDENE